MGIRDYLKIFFILFLISYFGISETMGFSATGNSGVYANIDQGNITLFSQNYSENNTFQNYVFIAKVQGNNNYDRLYRAIYGTLKTDIRFNNSSKGLEYRTIRDSPLPYSLFPAIDTVSNIGIEKLPGNSFKTSETSNFCKASYIPLIQYAEQPRQSGSLYINNLTPMAKCTYQFSLNIDADDGRSFVELNTPGSKLKIQKMDNNTTLTSYFQNSSKRLEYKTVLIGKGAEKCNFKVIFDGLNKTNTIYTEDGGCIVTPFYSLERQRLPYVDFSNGYLKFTTFIIGEGEYLDLNIYSLNQQADRKLITTLGSKKLMPFGLDGPHARNTTEQGISYLENKNGKGTIWFDVNYLRQYNETDLEYLRNLVANSSWEVGIHYSEELNSLPLPQAYKLMDFEYQEIYTKIGKKPTSWCSLRNADNISHAVYAYEKLGMLWRNGESGVNAEKEVGNLDDDTWSWWGTISKKGMIYPVFTHELDQDPAIKYSISSSKFRNWVDNYYSNNASIVSFYEYSQINRNTYNAYFDDLKYDEHFLKFNAHTNGAKSLANINISTGKDTQVYDNTSGEFLNYTSEQDKSITFWVENGHTYSVKMS